MERSRILAAVPTAALVAIGAMYLWEVVTLSGIPVARDMQMFFIPQKRLLWEAYQSGAVPHWTPYVGNGAPFHANMQSGFFYPPHWLYAVLPFYVAFNLALVFHFLLGGVFAYLLCRALGVERASAYVGAVCWMLGGYFASLLNLVNALQAAAWTPGLAWATLRVLQIGSVHRVVTLVLVAVCAGLAGEPQTVLLSLVCTGVVVASWTLRERPAPSALGGAAVKILVAGAFALGLAMVQLLPTAEFLRESGRGVGLSLEQAAAFDLKPERLIYLLVPTDFRDPDFAFGLRSIIGAGDPWLFSIYVGAAFPILAWFAVRGPRRRESISWLLAAVIAVLVGLGDNTPIFPWLFENVPGLGAFRFPEKYFLVAAFSVMVVCAYGVEEVLARRRAKGAGLWGAAYVALPLLFLAFIHVEYDAVRDWALGFGNLRMADDYSFAFRIWQGNLLKLALIAALVALLIWTYRAEKLSRRWFGVMLCAVISGDLAVAHRDINPVVEQAFYEEPPEVLRHIPLESIQKDFRYRATRFDSLSGTLPVLARIPLESQKWLWQQIMGPNVGQPWGVLQQDAWDAVKLKRAEDERSLHRVLEPERRWRLLRVQSVRYVHSIFALEVEGEARQIPLDTLGGYLYELEDPLPRAYVVPTATWVRDDVAAINRVLDASFDLEASVVLTDSTVVSEEDGAVVLAESMTTAPTDALAFPGAEILHADPHEVRIGLNGSRTGYAVLTDSYHPGWTATVDGEKRPIHLANFFFRAVEIGPGDEEVVFSYEPRAYRTGRMLSAASLTFGAIIWVTLGVRRRRRTIEGD